MYIKSRKNSLYIFLFLLPVLILFFAYFIYPLGFVFATSTLDWNGISKGEFVGLGNYVKNFQNKTFVLSLKNNFIWLFANGILQVGMAAMVALILARRPKFWRSLRTIYFLPNVISQVAIAMMWAALYNAEYGAINQFLVGLGLEQFTHNWLGEYGTALSAIIVQQVFYIGYFMIIILSSVMTIPDSLYEAAEIDGANVFQQELHITLPMIKDILVTAITLAAAYGLRHFEATFLLTNGGPANRTSVLGIMLYKNLSALKYGRASSISVTLVVIGLIVIVLIRSTIGRKSSASDLNQ